MCGKCGAKIGYRKISPGLLEIAGDREREREKKRERKRESGPAAIPGIPLIWSYVPCSVD